MGRKLKVLIADDSQEDVELLVLELERADFEVDAVRVDTEAEYRSALTGPFDLVLSDFRMPRFDGLRALAVLKELNPEIPFILVSGTIGEETAVMLMKQGAADYLLKDRLARLGNAVTQALEAARLRREQREAAAALQASEKLFRSTLENLMEGCQIIDRDWRYRYLNEVAAGHGQKPVQELLGRTVQESFPGIEGTPLFSLLSDCMKDGQARQIENLFEYPGGGSAWFHLFVQPVPEGLFILSLDITSRKQAEDALRASEVRFRELLENVDLIALTLDHLGRVTFCNDHLLRLTGWERHEVMGKDAMALFLPASMQEEAQDFRSAIAAGKFPAHRETPIRTRDGNVREIAWNNIVLRDGSRNVRGLASIGEDVTERKLATKKIEGQLEELRRWHDLTVGREDRVLALKAEVNALLAAQGKPPRYTAGVA